MCTHTHTDTHSLPQTDVSVAVCRWAFRATALRCVAQVCWLYPSVSCNLAGRAMFNIALLWWIYCSNPHTVFTRGCQASSDHDPFRSNTHPLAQRQRLGVTQYPDLQEPICEKELNVTKDGDKKHLSHTWQDNKVFIHPPQWLMDIKINEILLLSDYSNIFFTIK